MSAQLTERAPGFIGTAGVLLVQQANVSCMHELMGYVMKLRKLLNSHS